MSSFFVFCILPVGAQHAAPERDTRKDKKYRGLQEMSFLGFHQGDLSFPVGAIHESPVCLGHIRSLNAGARGRIMMRPYGGRR
jgi:hypothetical protein